MDTTISKNKNYVYVYIVVISSYIIFYLAQDSLWDMQLKLFDNIYLGSLIFFPHGVRVISFFLYKEKSLIPIFLAHLFTGFWFQNEVFSNFEIIIRSTLSVMSIYLAYKLLTYKSNDLSILLKSFIYFVILSSLFNSLFATIFFDFISIQSVKVFISYLIGDLLGSLLLFFLLGIFNKALKNY